MFTAYSKETKEKFYRAFAETNGSVSLSSEAAGIGVQTGRKWKNQLTAPPKKKTLALEKARRINAINKETDPNVKVALTHYSEVINPIELDLATTIEHKTELIKHLYADVDRKKYIIEPLCEIITSIETDKKTLLQAVTTLVNIIDRGLIVAEQPTVSKQDNSHNYLVINQHELDTERKRKAALIADVINLNVVDIKSKGIV